MTTGRINQVMNCIPKSWVSFKPPPQRESVWSSRIQELSHRPKSGTNSSHLSCGSTMRPVMRRLVVSTSCTSFAQPESLHRCTTRLIPIWFQYDFPYLRTSRKMHFQTASRRRWISSVSNPASTPNQQSHSYHVSQHYCTTLHILCTKPYTMCNTVPTQPEGVQKHRRTYSHAFYVSGT